MQQEVSDIPIPEAVNELADDILCELRKSGVPVSGRKYLNYFPLAQAKAWLSGHEVVESVDLLAEKLPLAEARGPSYSGGHAEPYVRQSHAGQSERHPHHGAGGPGRV